MTAYLKFKCDKESVLQKLIVGLNEADMCFAIPKNRSDFYYAVCDNDTLEPMLNNAKVDGGLIKDIDLVDRSVIQELIRNIFFKNINAFTFMGNNQLFEARFGA